MKIWFTSDWHLGEDRFQIMGRPFKDTLHLHESLIELHNKYVAPEDMVYMLGDVCYQKSPASLRIVSDFNGRKILIRGNHDRVLTDEDFKPYFEQVIPEGAGLELDDKIKLYLTHYPSRARADRFNLVGHIHGAWKVQLNMLNVGVDVNHFRPISMDDVVFFHNAICNFYDADVWVADHPANAFKETRGKKSVYFQ